MKLNTMKILHLLTVLLLFSSFCSVLSHPSRPLNERTTELALQEAWLLIDDQNQSKQNLPDMMRRKVVAKSVFIAPTFKPEELPPCADGYTSDAMGRCVKIIQLDPDEHLKFLFQKLVGNFDAIPESQEEGMPTSGPVQFTIDLDLTKNSQESDDSLKSTDVALVFTTSNTKTAQRGDEHVQSDQAKTATENLNFSFVPAPTNGSFDLDKIHTKNEEKNSGDTETTTTTTASTTEATTELAFSTTLSFGDETPTTPPDTTQTETPEPTTFVTETDNTHGHALFFKVPPPVQNPENTQKIGTRIKFEDETMNNDQPEIQDSTNVNHASSSRIIFKDEHSSDLGDLIMSENVRHPSHRIRFPNERDQSLYLVDSGKDLGSLYQFRRPQRQNQKPNLVQGNQGHPETNSDFANDRSQPNPKFVFNHRNRDKNFWQLPSTWRESSPNKTLVLRFSRMPGQGNFTLSDINSHRSEPLFRQVRIEDLSYIFGHRRKRNSR